MHREPRAPVNEKRRHEVFMAFLGAGQRQKPARALGVTALASARRMVACHRRRGEPIAEWLVGEIRLRGIQENAAVLALLEVPEYRQAAAQAYLVDHPDRLDELNRVLAVLV
jgi:hypothetical protein